ncbi:nibrin isoform X2 [Calliopsis andreniformis]|uniref:nibrin isoform X2 n=1 Tax=Calliopsis andreniformis TaxID=337506 RepID=UPI003FCDF21E
MWYLEKKTGKRIYLAPKKELTFGRKKTDIILQNDESVSRLHASICIEPRNTIETNETISICKLKDMGSKYGTYILLGEEEKIEIKEQEYHLKHQDQIRFGLQNHIFTVIYVPVVTMVSTMTDNDKNTLQNIMNEIDGIISDKWTNNCTHLTVSKATLTEKVTWAMAFAIPIVTLDYWKQVKCAINNGDQLPKYEDFVPFISETLINKEKVSLCPNKNRKTLFQNLIFIHFSIRQYKMYGKMISLAGGKSLLYSKKPLSNKELCAPNVIVLQYPNSDVTQSTQNIIPEYDSIYNMLQTNKRKMIPESDIPLAILHCSVEKYCNPHFKFGEFLKRTQSKLEFSEVLAIDTQDVRALPKVISNVPVKPSFSMKNSKHIEIPESCDISSNSGVLIEDKAQIEESSILQKNEETKDTLNTKVKIIPESYTSIQETVQNTKEGCFIKIATKYIPETNDSFTSNETQETMRQSPKKISNSRQQSIGTLSIEILKESMIVNKGTPTNDSRIVDLSAVTEALNIERSRTLTPKTDYNSLKDTSPVITEDSQKPEKRKKDSCEINSNEECVASGRKKVRLEDVTKANTGKNIPSTLSNEIQENQTSCNLLRNDTSSLQGGPNYKKFRKIYNNVPDYRVTLNDMYIWKKYNMQIS